MYVKFGYPGCIILQVFCGQTDKQRWKLYPPPRMPSASVMTSGNEAWRRGENKSMAENHATQWRLKDNDTAPTYFIFSKPWHLNHFVFGRSLSLSKVGVWSQTEKGSVTLIISATDDEDWRTLMSLETWKKLPVAKPVLFSQWSTGATCIMNGSVGESKLSPIIVWPKQGDSDHDSVFHTPQQPCWTHGDE